MTVPAAEAPITNGSLNRYRATASCWSVAGTGAAVVAKGSPSWSADSWKDDPSGRTGGSGCARGIVEGRASSRSSQLIRIAGDGGCGAVWARAVDERHTRYRCLQDPGEPIPLERRFGEVRSATLGSLMTTETAPAPAPVAKPSPRPR